MVLHHVPNLIRNEDAGKSFGHDFFAVFKTYLTRLDIFFLEGIKKPEMRCPNSIRIAFRREPNS